MRQSRALALLAVLALGACPTDPGPNDNGNDDETTSHALVGTWSGTWEDTDYMVTGDMSFTVTQDGDTLSGEGTIDLTGAGGSATQTGTAMGTIAGDDVSFDISATGVGTGSGTLTGLTVSGSGTHDTFGAFVFDGTLSADGTTLTGTFDFTEGTGGQGVATVTRQ